MDMEEEEEAKTTGSETETENSQAEEVNDDESADRSSEGEGDTIHSEDVSEESEDILALEENEDKEEAPEGRPKYVFEPLRPAKAGKPIPAKSKGKTRSVIELSEEGESFDLDDVHSSDSEEVVSDRPPAKSKKVAKPISKGASTKAVAKKKVVESTDEEMESLTRKVGKATLSPKGKAVRKSTRAKAG